MVLPIVGQDDLAVLLHLQHSTSNTLLVRVMVDEYCGFPLENGPMGLPWWG